MPGDGRCREACPRPAAGRSRSRPLPCRPSSPWRDGRGTCRACPPGSSCCGQVLHRRCRDTVAGRAQVWSRAWPLGRASAGVSDAGWVAAWPSRALASAAVSAGRLSGSGWPADRVWSQAGSMARCPSHLGRMSWASASARRLRRPRSGTAQRSGLRRPTAPRSVSAKAEGSRSRPARRGWKARSRQGSTGLPQAMALSSTEASSGRHRRRPGPPGADPRSRPRARTKPAPD